LQHPCCHSSWTGPKYPDGRASHQRLLGHDRQVWQGEDYACLCTRGLQESPLFTYSMRCAFANI
jgi:hypothetical protein